MIERILRPIFQCIKAMLKHGRETLESSEFGRRILYDVDNKGIFEDIHLHEIMIADTVRMNNYYNAINRYVKPDDIVVDLGTGTGILSLFAAQKNPKKIYAIDHSEFISLSKKIAEKNNIRNIDFLQVNSRVFKPEEKVDIILHEQMGSNLIDENMVENILDLKKRILKDSGKILPGKFELFLEPITLKKEYKVPYLWENNVHGIDFKFLKNSEEYDKYKRPLKLTIDHSAVDYFLCEPEAVISFDLNTINEENEIPKFIETSKKVVRSGSMDGLCFYFNVIFDDEINFDTSPLSPRTHWMHPLFRTESRYYNEGEDISFKFTMDIPFKRETWSLSVK